MHILSVIHYPTYGGPHNRNACITPVLRDRGIQTTVLLPSEPGNAATRLRDRGVSVVQVPLSRLRAVWDPYTHIRTAHQFRRDVGRIRRLIRALKIDLVLVNGLANPHSAIAAHLEGVPVVWQLLDTFAPSQLRRVMMPLITTVADVIMSTGRAVAEGHPGATAFGERLVLFFPPVDPVVFMNSTQGRRAARERLDLPPDSLVVGTVGNINPMKGHDVFVEAAGRGHRERPNVRFVILGGAYPQHADYAASLLRSAAKWSLKLGQDLIIADPGADVAGLAPAFDVFWLTSNPRSEGIPTAIGEAMALGIPVVASRVGSVHEAVVDGVTGRLVAPRDADALIRATLPYLDDESVRASAGAAARAQSRAALFAECVRRPARSGVRAGRTAPARTPTSCRRHRLSVVTTGQRRA